MTEGIPNFFVFVAVAAFVPLTLWAFSSLGPRRGMLVSLFGGLLFLPWFDVVGKSVPLFHSKPSYVPGVVLLVSLVMDSGRWRVGRVRLIDLPIMGLIGMYAIASLVNHGPYDAASVLVQAGATWGAPYLLGRVYLRTRRDLLALLTALVAAGLVYIPFIAWELRMSPQLHRQLYGFHQHSFLMAVRYGGYRPMVFLFSGIMMGLFMASAALAAYWLWRTRAVARVAGLRIGWAALALIGTTVLVKSTGAIIWLAMGIGVLEGTRRLRGAALVLALAAVPPLYCAVRMSGWSGQALIEQASRFANPERVSSLSDRIHNEDLLIDRGLLKAWSGWSTTDFQVRDETGREISVSDGMWVIVLGVGGIPALLALLATLIWPVIAALRRWPARLWAHPAFATVAAASVLLLIFAMDDLLNSMLMPFFPAAAGGLATLLHAPRPARRAPAPQAAPSPPDPSIPLAGSSKAWYSGSTGSRTAGDGGPT